MTGENKRFADSIYRYIDEKYSSLSESFGDMAGSNLQYYTCPAISTSFLDYYTTFLGSARNQLYEINPFFCNMGDYLNVSPESLLPLGFATSLAVIGIGICSDIALRKCMNGELGGISEDAGMKKTAEKRIFSFFRNIYEKENYPATKALCGLELLSSIGGISTSVLNMLF